MEYKGKKEEDLEKKKYKSVKKKSDKSEKKVRDKFLVLKISVFPYPKIKFYTLK